MRVRKLSPLRASLISRTIILLAHFFFFFKMLRSKLGLFVGSLVDFLSLFSAIWHLFCACNDDSIGNIFSLELYLDTVAYTHA